LQNLSILYEGEVPKPRADYKKSMANASEKERVQICHTENAPYTIPFEVCNYQGNQNKDQHTALSANLK
jgi:hypothetical protein